MKTRVLVSANRPAPAPWTLGLVAIMVIIGTAGRAGELVRGRTSLVLENPAARLVIDLEGGSVADFRIRGSELNPLSWSAPALADTSTHGFGHFLCLDRWGPPSRAE